MSPAAQVTRVRSIPREVRLYLAVWGTLLALLALTVASSFVRLGGWNAAANLVIAGAKALLVATFFMHLRDRPALVRMAALIGFAWLAILVGLSLADVLTRA
jgi:cytochrome c oxidase subunit 4